MPSTVAVVAELAMAGGAGGGCAPATFPADLRLRSMEVIPKPCDGFVLLGVITMVRRLGEGGCGVLEGDVSLMSVLTWMWDCDEFLGLPRRKDPKIVVLVGGDSFPACRWPSIRASSLSSTMKEGVWRLWLRARRKREKYCQARSGDSCQGPIVSKPPVRPLPRLNTDIHKLIRLIFPMPTF